MSRISIVISDRYFNKDPMSSALGKRIVYDGLQLLNTLGFEQFTFKKLADEIGSTEASIYRYFENKQKLLIYLTSWYWSWADYQIDYNTHHLTDPMEKLNKAWEVLCHICVPEDNTSMDVATLHGLVIRESDKTYLTKHVDQINKEGLFLDFKTLCHRIALMISETRPEYHYPHALVSTLIEASHQQYFFASHLPSLTEINKNDMVEINVQVHAYIMDLVRRILKPETL